MLCASSRVALVALTVAWMPGPVGTPVRAANETPPARPATPEQIQFFETRVRPILEANCFSCHGAEKKVKGGLRLTSRKSLLKGGNSGPAVILDRPDESLLLQAVNYRQLKMPPKGKLARAQIETLERWIQMGAPWSAKPISVRHGPPPVDDEARRFWSFRAVERPPVPVVQNADWAKHPIDAFILSKLEQANLLPAPPADKAVLLRRLCYDLTGLPPTPEEVTAFVNDASPDAYEKSVDRLLASPAYGEHWARHWLDLVRYAETNSFERDGPKPNIWRYRDYVIRSFNEDKPYDQFIKEQLAGDELDTITPETIIATGYYCLGQWDDEPADRTQAYYDELDDIIATTGQTFLGLTVNCARCHDHKIDPFPQKDYYQLLAFFHGLQRYNTAQSLRSLGSEAQVRNEQQALRAYRKQMAAVDREIRAIEESLRPHLQGGERDDFRYEANKQSILEKHVPAHLSDEVLQRWLTLKEERRRLDRNRPEQLQQALSIHEKRRLPGATISLLSITGFPQGLSQLGRYKANDTDDNGPWPGETFVFLRGNPHNKGAKVEPGFPSVLTSATPVLPEPRPGAQTSGRRRVLAEWLAARDNPLTARAMVNRIWQFHFGRGLVRSSSDFGYHGTPPTHPELLDWLASEFVARGWKLKPMHKLIVMSNSYRMSSRPDPSALARDAENDLLWRFDPRRLSAEEVRDSILAVCGNLNRKMGGPSIHPTIPHEVLAGQSMPGNGWDLKCPPEERARRSVYVHIKRSLPVPILMEFDAPDPDGSCPVRFVTTQPAQALGMLNSDFVNDQAEIFAAALREQAGEDTAAQVRLALRRVTQREPVAGEMERSVAFIAKMRDKHRLGTQEALRQFCLLLLNLNEFVYVD
jgi:mono/diheme cytochrome c family protein